MADLYRIVHSSPEIETIGAYISDVSSPAHNYVGRESEFLAISGPDDQTNFDRVKLLYTAAELEANSNTLAINVLLKPGVVFYIPHGELDVVGILTQGVEVVSNDVAAFKARALAQLEGDPGYERSFNTISGKGHNGKLKVKYPQYSVWVWCKALSKDNVQPELFENLLDSVEGELINVTPFIQNLSTTVTPIGGTFKITLPPLTCTLRKTFEEGKEVRRWSLKKSALVKWKGGEEYYAQDTLFKEIDSNDELLRNTFFFHQVIQSNDVVFIKFETLKMEEEDRREEGVSFTISKSKLVGGNYDMIGLVDNVPIKFNSEKTDVSISINGRDLSKLFKDDGTYFFNLENITGQYKIAGSATANNPLTGRLIGSNALFHLSLYQNNSIQHVLQFVIQQLANIGVIPDTLFSAYGDRRNTVYLQNPETTGDDITFKQKDAKGIWQIIKLVIDDDVTRRRIVDSSMSSANGPLLNFIKKVCQNPFVQFYMDTYGDMYYLIVRKPPFDKIGVLSYLKKQVKTEEGTLPSVVIDVDGGDIIDEDLDFSDEVYSWYTFRPKNLYAAGGSSITTAYVPALFFPEYSEIWGSRPYSTEHNYNPYYTYTEEGGKTDISRFEQQAYEDLRYLVETHAHLPFTREGSFTIQGGDRRIKVGNFIRYKLTGEIFHIDSVTQVGSINDKTLDRSTKVGVSRGMIEKYIEGVEVNGINMSYFNVINTDINITLKKYDFVDANGNQKTYTGVDREKIFETMKVNRSVFMFFLKRHQFDN